uniref:Caveolin n=1 Tax=Ciona intestinalis TaxID=7719 RepID=A0A1W2W6U9_CIOIN|nr:caveolin-3 [Ciona intestinalis]|eukprot:XP_002121873.1 caveolin-3 [Ciona intestinalis]
MAENGEQKGDFEAQHEAATPGKTESVGGNSAPGTPGSRRSGTNDATRRFDSDDDDVTKPCDEVKVPIDESGMDNVELDSVKEVKLEQPKSKSKKQKKEKKEKKPDTTDYVNRDPRNLQESVKVNFADIIAEPSGAHSFNTVWGTSYKVYSVTKYWVYRIMTLVFGVPCALIWGVYFACLAFLSIWWIMPCIRCLGIKINFIGKIWSLTVRTILDPVFESIGLLLSRIRIVMSLRRD